MIKTIKSVNCLRFISSIIMKNNISKGVSMFKLKSVPLLGVLTLILMVLPVVFISCSEPNSKLPAVAPKISPNGGLVSSTGTIELSTTTENARIYYTLNGDEPTESSFLYTDPFTLSSNNTTVKAIATHPDMLDSSVTSSTPFTFMPVVASPIFTPDGGEGSAPYTITLTTATEDASIYYTLNGDIPTTSSTLYTEPVDFSICTTLQAIAVKDGCENSSTASTTYTIRGPAGGFVFYDRGNNDGEWRYLEAAPASWNELVNPSYEWGIKGLLTNTKTGTGAGTGSANTIHIIATHTAASEHAPAAEACAAYSVVYEEKTYEDWFLPSKDELNLMYLNLKSNGLGGFADGYYWSSSEVDANTAWLQHFANGYQQDEFSKEYDYSVRPVRAFSLVE